MKGDSKGFCLFCLAGFCMCGIFERCCSIVIRLTEGKGREQVWDAEELSKAEM